MDVVSLVDLSDDEEDISYLNAVTRLKALKEKNCVVEKPQDDPTNIVIDISNNPSNVNIVQPMEELIYSKNSHEGFRRQRRHCKRQPTRSCNDFHTTHDLNDSMEIISLEEEDVRTNAKSQRIACIAENNRAVESVDLISDDESNEDENYLVDVKVQWRSKTVVHLNIRRYESFHKVFQYFSAMESVPEEQILILRNNLPINQTDTPISIDLSVLDILEGGIVNPEILTSQSGCQINQNEIVDKNLCKIKVQTADKQSLTVTIKRDQRFTAVILSCAEQLNIEESKIKLYFDGEQISKSDTPESLDLEQEACVDLKVVT